MVALRAPVPLLQGQLCWQSSLCGVSTHSGTFEDDRLHFRHTHLISTRSPLKPNTSSLGGVGQASSAGGGCAMLINSGWLTHMLHTPCFVHMCLFLYTPPKVGHAVLYNLKCSNPHVG